jgi:hypothetical protein
MYGVHTSLVYVWCVYITGVCMVCISLVYVWCVYITGVCMVCIHHWCMHGVYISLLYVWCVYITDVEDILTFKTFKNFEM